MSVPRDVYDRTKARWAYAYEVICVDKYTKAESVQAQLNRLGRQGWRVVQALGGAVGHSADLFVGGMIILERESTDGLPAEEQRL